MIPITKPFIPPLDKYEMLLAGIWKRNWLTNNGPLVNKLEIELKKYLGIDYLLFLGNGTIAIQLAIKALELKGEIITTPFSYVATTSSIVWENCRPIFVDICPQTLNIDAQKIEPAITPETSAILATHVYGNPCDIKGIEFIAEKYGLRVIYDGAHAFGVKYEGKSIFSYGDITTTSFHATKIFHTVEGGAVITEDSKILERMSFMRNFGHNGPDQFNGVGINAKNSEFHAAMGLCNLPYITEIINQRKKQSEYYNIKLKNLDVTRQFIKDVDNYNFAYYPIIFPSEEKLLFAKKKLELTKIFPRRYFYPSLSHLSYLEEKGNTPICDDISRRILCLPLYHSLTEEEINLVCRILLRVQNYS